jgi:hypothetical protein
MRPYPPNLLALTDLLPWTNNHSPPVTKWNPPFVP